MSYVLNCVDCGHCRDTRDPVESDPDDMTTGRAKIVEWIDDFVKQ